MPQRRALIVAIDAYDYPNTLPSCINDGRAIAALLAGSGYTGKQLFDASATRANVLSGLDWLLAGAQPDDDLVFYYSGHGYQPNIGGNLQQSLVLIDGMLLDRDFTPRTALVPAGTLTVLLDACFSGGFDKFLIRSAAGKALVEQPKVKAYVPMAGDDVRLGLPPPVGAAPAIEGLQFFGGGAPLAASHAAKSIQCCTPVAAKSGGVALGKGAAIEMNGLLIAACMETETASASTAATEGKSAFTYALLSAIDRLGQNRSNQQLFQAAAGQLQSLGFQQTPVLREPTQPGDLVAREFLTLEPMDHDARSVPPGLGRSVVPDRLEADALSSLLAVLLPALWAATAKALPAPPPAKTSEQQVAEAIVAMALQLLASR
jgi:hypothetical protein